MNVAHRRPMTSEEFLAWDAGQELRHEFDGVRPIAMVGGTFAHTTIQGNVIAALKAALRGNPCRPGGPDMRVPTGAGRYRYPGALVTCTPPPPDATEVTEPVALFEVLSASTANDDRTVKAREYLALPSLRHYVMLEQDRAFATVISRSESGWTHTLVRPGGTVELPAITAGLAMTDLYDGLAFAAGDVAPP